MRREILEPSVQDPYFAANTKRFQEFGTCDESYSVGNDVFWPDRHVCCIHAVAEGPLPARYGATNYSLPHSTLTIAANSRPIGNTGRLDTNGHQRVARFSLSSITQKLDEASRKCQVEGVGTLEDWLYRPAGMGQSCQATAGHSVCITYCSSHSVSTVTYSISTLRPHTKMQISNLN